MTFTRSHKLESSDEHYTPALLFDTLNLTFGTDVCAPKGGVPWIPAINYYDKERDGLVNNWNVPLHLHHYSVGFDFVLN